MNLDEAWWHLPDPKNRNPIWLPLSTQAVKLLEERPRVNGNPYVFPGKNPKGHIKDPRALWQKISDAAGLKISSHDCRRSFTTYGVTECGIDLYKIELLTSHVPKSVTMTHYLETKRLQYLQPDIQKISDWIERKAAISRAQSEGTNVVDFRAAKNRASP